MAGVLCTRFGELASGGKAAPVWVRATAVGLPGLKMSMSAILNQYCPMGLPDRLMITPGPMRSSSLSLISCTPRHAAVSS